MNMNTSKRLLSLLLSLALIFSLGSPALTARAEETTPEETQIAETEATEAATDPTTGTEVPAATTEATEAAEATTDPTEETAPTEADPTEETDSEENYGISLTSDGGDTNVATADVTSTAVASITSGDTTTYYSSLGAAVADVPVGTSASDLGAATTITILCDINNAEGITVPSYVNLTIDFNNHTYTLTGPGAGSTGTETQGFQLLKDSTIVMKNGTIKIAEGANNIKRIIQSYANVTLTDMIFYSANQVGGEDLCLSFNNGTVTFTGKTSVYSSDNSANVVAFDVYYWSSGYPNGTTVKFNKDYTGTIDGYILYDTTDSEKATLTIQGNGTFNGGIKLSTNSTTAAETAASQISITGGTFSTDVTEYCANGYAAVYDSTTGKYTIDDGVAAVYENGVCTDVYGTLTAAISAATSGQTVKLLTDVSNETIGISASQNIILDLNGHTLSSSEGITTRLITMRGGNLTITDSSSGGIITSGVGDAVILIAGGTLTVNGGTVSATSTIPAIVNAWQSDNYAGYASTVIVNGGKVTAAGAPAIRNNAKGCSITVNGGEIVGYSNSIGYYIVDSASEGNYASVIINGGYFTTNETNANQGLFYQANTGSIVISGGYFNNAITWINSAMRAAGYSNTTLSEGVTYNGTTYSYTVSSAAILYGTIDSSGNVTYIGGSATPQAAVNALRDVTVSDGSCLYLELNADVIDQFGIGNEKTVILELNGYNITTTDDAAIAVSGGASLTVRDSVGTSVVTSSYANGTVRNRGGVLVIESGVYTNSSGCVFQSNTSDSNSGTYTTAIEGGSFNGTFSVVLGSLSITGGYFTSDPSTYVTNNDYAVFGNDDDTYLYTVAEADGAVAQIGSVNYKTLSEAVAAASSGDTVKLLADTVLTGGITLSGKTITLDLNNCTVSRVSSADGYSENYLIYVDSDADLTVTDSSETKGGKLSSTYDTYITGYAIQVEGSLTVESGTLRGVYGVYSTGSNANVTVSGGTVSGYQRGISVAASATSSTLTVSGGTVKGTATSTYSYGIIQFAGTLNVTGGTVSGETYGIQIGTSSVAPTANISGGTVTATNYYAICNYGTLEVTGGTVSGNSIGIFNVGTGANATIGETGSSSNDSPKIVGTGTGGDGIYTRDGATLTVNSGTISGTTEGGAGIVVIGDSTNTTTLTVNGGVIEGHDYGITTNGISTCGKCEITINGGKVSGAWGMYLPAVNSTTTISGTAEITGSTTGIEIRAGSLNVSGGTIKSEASPEEFTFNGSGTTVVGAGIAISQHTTNQEIAVTITGGEISGCYGVFEVNTVSGNTSNVTLTIGSDSTSKITGTEAAVYSVSVSGYETEDGDDSYYQNGNTTFSISGGSFSTQVDPEYCAENYAPTLTTVGETEYYGVTGAVAKGYDSENGYVAGYASLEAAIANTSDSVVTIQLVDNCTVSTNATASKDMTIDLNGKNLTIGASIDTNKVTLTVDNGATVVIMDSSSLDATGVVANYGVITVNGTLDIRDLGYTTDATSGGGLLGQTNGKISLGASGVFIVPDVWNDSWSNETSGVWSPNWTSATGTYTYGGATYTGIFSSIEKGATVYSFGKGWKCTTEFTGSYDSSTTYWEESGTYLVEYFKTERGGEGIAEETADTWTYPDAVTDNTIFAGWYTTEDFDTACATTYTSGVAYAKFVQLVSDDNNAGVINYLGGSLRMNHYYQDGTTDVDYSMTDLRFGYDIIIPTDCSATFETSGGSSYSWEWSWQPEGSSSWYSVYGNNYTVLTDTDLYTSLYSSNTIGTSVYRSNLLLTGIPSSDYGVTAYSKLSVTYVTADGTTVTAKESDADSHSVNSVAYCIVEKGSETEKGYAQGLLYAHNTATSSSND